MLELTFQSRDVRALCEQDTAAQQALGAAGAAALRNRLSDLEATSNAFELLVGDVRLDGTVADGSICLLDLDDGWVLSFRANHADLPRSPDGKVDWQCVSRIQIVEISRSDGAADGRDED